MFHLSRDLSGTSPTALDRVVAPLYTLLVPGRHPDQGPRADRSSWTADTDMVMRMPGWRCTLHRAASAAALVGLALAPVAACQDPGSLSDSEKRARIDELYESYKSDFPGVRETTVEALVGELSAPVPPVLVDVRSDEERAVSMIPGALSREEFEARRDELAGREVVTYCTIGYRSGVYTRELMDEGWTASNLRGSILAWTHAGGELVHEGSPTRRVHVYGPEWNLVPRGYEAVW
jgi:sodium/bile acid cotransporter 7